MNRNKIKLILIILIVFIIANNNFSFADAKLSNNDATNGYEEGLIWGKNTGHIYGQKDYLNNKKANWENVYKLEKDNIIKDYNLDKKEYAYRSNFLEGFKEGFQVAYEDVYDRPNMEITASLEDLALEHGSYFGKLLATKHATNHAYLNKKSDWKREIPSDNHIVNQYKLNNDIKKYTDNFLKAYKKEYEIKYQEIYSEFNYKREKVTKENAFIHGENQGETAGYTQAMIDFLKRKSNNWQRALNEFEIEKNLLIRYGLDNENNEYILGFINGFRDGFMKGYNEYYQKFNMGLGERNVNYKRVSMLEDTIEFEDEFNNIINGVKQTDKITTVKLYIPPGSIYGETYISLQREDIPVLSTNNKYIPITKVYDIGIVNDMGKIKLQKPWILNFEYFGSSRAGIYELKNNQWNYIYSYIEDGRIFTEIPNNTYKGGKYIVMVDENYGEIRDISMHWARSELYTYLRRGYIRGDENQKYYPDNNLTRGELLVLLSKINNWDLSNKNIESSKFNDRSTFSNYKSYIDYAVHKNYIKGYDDNTFRPNAYISYYEIQSIMRKITDNHNFKWKEIAESIIYEKYTRPKSRLGMDQKISKAEAVYMLHELEGKQEL